MNVPSLYWLPEAVEWRSTLSALEATTDDAAAWTALVRAASFDIDFLRTRQLDRALVARFGAKPPASLQTRPVRLAVLASSTVDYLLPALRVGALRRGLWLEAYITDYGQYLQELHDRASGLHRFAPTAVLLALDTRHLVGGLFSGGVGANPGEATADVLDRLEQIWSLIGEKLDAPIIQQTLLPIYPSLIGGNEHRLHGSAASTVSAVNAGLRALADKARVDVLALDAQVAEHGLSAWYDIALWHRAKQEIHPAASPLYGDLVGRLLAARQGRSSKCLVLDLDNTLWGGVIGDDGLDGIVLGQGSALGEAFVDFQTYALAQSHRGVILAVCSKNDEVNAKAPFEEHPEMVLKLKNIAAFVANWEDKATNLRRIAEILNIGIDSLVFADDNPFERNIVRRELPEVQVPELPEDPSLYARCLADAGYFEAVQITPEDFERSGQYQGNQQREFLRQSTTDLDGYLKSLSMELQWKPFDSVGLARIVQLINKTNQFNLTTRRYTEQEVLEIIADPNAFGLQLRLVDQFGDNGIIGIVIGRLTDAATVTLDTWLMSCRVLGRQVEEATLNVVAQQARAMGAERLMGLYRPTSKNGMVSGHYATLGFAPAGAEGAETAWSLSLEAFSPRPTHIALIEA
jgi:FkbH-like protein